MNKNLKEYFEKAISYSQYLENEQLLLKQKDDFEYRQYHELNLKRMLRNGKVANKKDKPSLLNLTDYSKNKLLIISEGWCGDAAQIVPYAVWLSKQLNMELRILYRDKNHELMNQFLTNGGMAIPVIIALDQNFDVLGHFAPRPTEAQKLMLQMKSEGKEKEEISMALQKWYNKDKGNQIVAEILDMMQATITS